MKPLYLDGQAGLRVVLDGPSLQVVAECEAVRRFPLRRISRVVVSGDVDWEARALLACADEGITVSFLDHDGRPRARFVGQPGERNELRQRVSDFLDRPDWRERYVQWKQAMDRREARLCAFRLCLDLETPNRVLGALVRARLARCMHRGEADRLRRWLRGLLYARAGSALRDLGLAAELELISALPNDIAAMLLWTLYPELIIWATRRSARTRAKGGSFVASPRMLAGFHEACANALDFRLAGILNCLHRWLVEL